MLKAQED